VRIVFVQVLLELGKRICSEGLHDVAAGQDHDRVASACSLGLNSHQLAWKPIGLLRNLVNALTDATDRGDAHPGSGPASRADRSDPSRRREPYQDLLDPRGPMGMPKIVSRAANSLGRGPRGGANVLTGIYLLSVLAIIIGLGIFFIV